MVSYMDTFREKSMFSYDASDFSSCSFIKNSTEGENQIKIKNVFYFFELQFFVLCNFYEKSHILSSVSNFFTR